MTFWDDVYKLREKGKIGRVWKVADIEKCLPSGKYSTNYINVVPANQSMTEDGSEIGNYVKRDKNPQDPMAWRIRPPKKSGKFQLIKDPEDDKVTQDAEFARAKSVVASVLSRPVPDEDPYPLRGAPYRHDDTLEPVALEDWEVLRVNAQFGVETARWSIAHEFARWCARSALNSGKDHIKSAEDVYAALDSIDFQFLFDSGLGTIDQREFDDWHRTSVAKLIVKYQPRLNVGWAAKMIAIYLKTTCYLAGFGREGLERIIHPPIDNILIDNLRKRSWRSPHIAVGLDRFDKISGLDLESYEAIIQSFELIAKERGCTLFEVEQYFRPR